MKHLDKTAFILFVLSFACAASLRAAEDYCEVMSIQGTARVTAESGSKPLNQGDLLKAGDIVETDAESRVDLAFDKQWNNVARIGENTKVTIKSVFPTGLKMDKGDIFSRLMKLPKGSTYEIQTPTAIAAVRGTVYWTEFSEGKTSVYNYSPSPVEVFNLDTKGNIQERVVVMERQKTEITKLSEAPMAPVKMTEAEVQKAGSFDQSVEAAVKEAVDTAREGRAPSVNDMEQKVKEKLAEMKGGAENPIATDDKRPAGGPGGPGNGDTGDAASGPNQGPNTLMTASEMPLVPAGEMPNPENNFAPSAGAIMTPPGGFKPPEPPPIPVMPPTTQIDGIQNRVDAAVNTVNNTINTQTMLTTTAPPGTLTTTTTTSPCVNSTTTTNTSPC